MNAPRHVSKSVWHLIRAGLLLLTVSVWLAGCGQQPIRVGFVAQLTGVQAELGVQERNGVQLAVDEINAAGGAAGRPIELIVRDDVGTPEGAQAADRELIAAGVVAIIGHATSAQTMAGLAVTNPARVVMLSPTATTPELSGLDDFFFRVGYGLSDRAHAFAQHIYQAHAITRMAAIYDTDNTAYSKAYLDAFQAKFEALGGRLIGAVSFSSKAQPDFAPVVDQLRASSPDGLLIIAADIDTALIAQRVRLMDWPLPLYTSAWAQTATLINTGGQAVEGLELEIANAFTDRTPAYLDFETRYQSRFGVAPSFGAVSGYEAAKVLAAALEKTAGQAAGLRPALLEIKNFNGVVDTFSFDPYGDAMRPFYLGTIRNGQFVDIKAYEPTEP